MTNRFLSIMYRLKFYGVTVLLIIIAIWGWNSRVDPAVHYARIEANARPLQQSLEAYRKLHHTYPQNLDALVPAFIPSIPEPDSGGYKWGYTLLKASSYELYVQKQQAYDGYVYYSTHGKWYEDLDS